MKVTIREKKIKDSRRSLYLDFYPAIPHPLTGKLTRREFLGLHVFVKPKNDSQKIENKETYKLAELIRSERQIAIQAESYGFLKKKLINKDLLPFFKELAEQHKQTVRGDRNNWMSVYNYIHQFSNGCCMAKILTEDFCNDFKKHLLEHKTFVKLKPKLANNSAVGYFNIFKRMVKIAFDAGLLEKDVAMSIPAIKKTETKREFLTLEEINLLAKTPCDLLTVKKAGLFSAFTGLRYCDIAKLTWQEVYQDDNGGYSIRFIQKKTKGVQAIPLAEDALKLMGERKNPTDKVFSDMLYSAWQNQKIKEWVQRAGIERKITFHNFRHSFATIQLFLGTDIMTIKDLLGHKNIQTTLIYAKVVSSSKREAVNKMKFS